jgi:hypothetical protein
MSSESFQIYMSSQNADVYKNTNNNNVEFYLPQIEIDDIYHIYISVANASIPISYYNVNDNNNTLNYNLSTGPIVNVVIPNGNYNVNTLLTTLNSLLINMTVTYNQITNKYTFIHATNDFTFINTSSCVYLLGISITGQSSISRVLLSNNCINLSPIRSFIVGCNLKTGNINLSNPEIQNMLCSIPISSNSFGIVNYTNDNNFRSNLFTNILNSISIFITDQDGQTINFNNVNWFVTLQLDIIKYVD